MGMTGSPPNPHHRPQVGIKEYISSMRVQLNLLATSFQWAVENKVCAPPQENSAPTESHLARSTPSAPAPPNPARHTTWFHALPEAAGKGIVTKGPASYLLLI